MIKKNLFLLLLLSLNLSALAYQIIPDSIAVGNVKVFIHPSAKPILEKEWNMISGNRKYVAGLIAKMRLYFPVIEPILKQGNIPDDFKYLCVQESSLNPNAISSSQAVGYWQFKYATAIDVGLKVNQEIDERRHILEATKGAVNYFSRNNGVLNNWMSTLLSYRVGLGTLKKSPYFNNWSGKTEIEVDSTTDWYILRFLAYKNFWEDQVGCFSDSTFEKNDVNLVCYNNTQGKNLYELSDELKISYDDLKKHNPWILKDYLPNDKSYTIYHPSNVTEFISTSAKKPDIDIKEEKTEELILTASVDTTKLYVPSQKSKGLYPKKKYKEILSDQVEIKIHKIKEGDNLTELAYKYGMTLESMLKLNNLDMNSLLSIGQPIKYFRKIPMLELISQKLDEKAQKMAEKLPKKEEIEVVEKELTPEIKEDYSVRKVSTKIEKEPLLIEPAISREINIKSDKDQNKIWVDSQLPIKKVDSSINKELPKEKPVEILEVKTQSTTKKKVSPQYHVVKPGENLFRIAKSYQIDLNDLRKWNSLSANQAITVGQKLSLVPTK